ncbi:MAG: chemotaxis protein CheA [bacterium]
MAEMDQKKLMEIFYAESQEIFEQFEENVVALEEFPDDDELANKVFRSAHTLKSSAAIVGLTEVSDFVHVLENILERIRSKELKITKKLISTILSALDFLKEMVKLGTEGNRINDDKRKNKLIQEMKRYEGIPSIAKEQTQRVPDKERKSKGDIPSGEKIFSFYKINLKFREDLFETGQDPLMLFYELEEQGKIVQVEIDASRLPDFDLVNVYKLYLSWTIIFKTEEPISTIENVFIFVTAENEITIEDITDSYKEGVNMSLADKKIGEILVDKGIVTEDDVNDALAGQKKIGEILVERGVVEPDEIESAVDEQEKSKGLKIASTIRVETDKLDKLVNLVGEMVIGLARIRQLMGYKASGQVEDLEVFARNLLNKGLNTAMEGVDRICRELQEHVMKVRMVPVADTFRRFQRLVRDMAYEQQKEVKLVLQGTETELDKNVIEKIVDPLKHMVRNAIAHGIESPNERVKKKKPEEATLTLKAYQSEGSIIIEVKDDGSGIDKQRVMEVARAKGLITSDKAITDQELFRLMFMPGFSTAKVADEYSGRGVGLDVVKKNIEDLRGSIDVESALNCGTTFIIKLPLTLAIIEGMNVKVGSEILTLPLLSIVESIRPKHEDVKTVEGKGEVIEVRGEYLPLVRLHRLFKIDTDKVTPWDALVVIIETDDGKKFGLLVDDVLGQQQAVIKSLESNLKKVEGTAGATILGDGTISLIIDVHGLENLAFRTVASLRELREQVVAAGGRA